MDITSLPHDVFLLIVAHLASRTTILCRRVSKRWRDAFTDEELSLQLLKWHFPRCREMRMAYADSGGDTSCWRGGEDTGRRLAPDEENAPSDSPNGNIEMLDASAGDSHEKQRWTAVFTTVARRYHHLRHATPYSIDKIAQGTRAPLHQDRFLGVAPWDRYLRLDDRTAPFHHPDPSWCYGGQEDGHGLLVYHVDLTAVESEGSGTVGDHVRARLYPWRLLDLETRAEVEVPFPHDDERIVRRVRLSDGVLAFEWCERMAYHQLNDREECHRHYVTLLDVVRCSCTRSDQARTITTATSSNTVTPSPSSSTTSKPAEEEKHTSHHYHWELSHRAEFKLHFLGLPLNTHDRFLSAHTRTRYAVYVWQPNRSPWGEDDPLESAVIWDTSSSPPRCVRRMPWAALEFYGLRQRAAPRLRGLALDERNLYLIEEEHRWARGPHGSPSPPRVHLVRSTGIPVVPAVVASGGEEGRENLEGARGGGEVAAPVHEEEIVQGPRWLDECGANGDVNLSFCSRAAAMGLAGAASPLSQGVQQHLGRSGHRAQPSTLAQEIQAAARAPTARWPGWAPCWRHEEFPYLTVSEAVDFQAGVRVAARHCFMLETLSVHVRPSLSVRGVVGGGVEGSCSSSGSSSSTRSSSSTSGERAAGAQVDGDDNGVDRAGRKGSRRTGQKKLKKKRKEEDTEGGGGEVQFPDEMWDELLGRGYICGDERWLVGEDRQGRVTVVRF